MSLRGVIQTGRRTGYFEVEVCQWVRLLEKEVVIRFRRGLLTASDRHLARYFRYVEEFPTFLPPEG